MPTVALPNILRSALAGLGLILATVCTPDVRAQEVVQLTWPTRHAAPPVEATPETVVFLPVLRAAVNRLAEDSVVQLALTQSAALGLSSADAAKLRDLVKRRYARISEDPVFKNVPSTLAYCYAAERPSHGLALVYRPAVTDATTPVLLFVHGSGGSFLWYPHRLAEWFPDHIIVCPSYGTDPSLISAAYLDESLRAAATRLKHPLAKPTLMGLSAGGFGTTRVYAAKPDAYRQLIVLAAYPPDDAFRAWPRTARAGWIVGEDEYYVNDGGFAAYSKSLAARSARYQGVVIPEAGHFFLLTHPAETEKALRGWLPAAAR